MGSEMCIRDRSWSLHVWCDGKCFFFARVQSDHHQPACRIVNPSQCGSSEPFMRATRQELRSHSMRLRCNGWGYIWGNFNISRVPREIYKDEARPKATPSCAYGEHGFLALSLFEIVRPSFNFCRIPSVLCYLHDDRMA